MSNELREAFEKFRTGWQCVGTPSESSFTAGYESGQVSQSEKLEVAIEALTKLRDCDWVISLPDRMDAVRDIAKAAIAKIGER